MDIIGDYPFCNSQIEIFIIFIYQILGVDKRYLRQITLFITRTFIDWFEEIEKIRQNQKQKHTYVKQTIWKSSNNSNPVLVIERLRARLINSPNQGSTN